MKKHIPKKILIVAAIVAVSLALTAPFAYAKYLGTTSADGNTGNGLIGPAKTDVDNLFIYMMNQALPIGSIFMSPAPFDVAGHFGGTWEAWGTGRAPAGVNVTGATGVLGDSNWSYSASGPDNIGGNGNTTRSFTLPSTSVVLGGAGLTLTPGGISQTSASSVTWNGGIGVTGPSGTIYPTSSMMTVPLIPHNHGVALTRPYAVSFPTGNQAFTTYYPSTGANNITSSGPSVGTVASGTQFSLSFPINLANWTAEPRMPVIDYRPPVHSYTPQYFSATGNLTLPSSYFSIEYSAGPEIIFDDETMQPYILVYMYKRTGLAKLS